MNMGSTRSHKRQILTRAHKGKLDSFLKYSKYILPYCLFFSTFIFFMNPQKSRAHRNAYHLIFIFTMWYRFNKLTMHIRKGHKIKSSLFTLLWFDPNFHKLLSTITIYITQITPVLLFLAMMIYSFGLSLGVFLRKIIPRINDAHDIEYAIVTIIKSQFIRYMPTILEIFLCPYLFFTALFNFSGKVLLCFSIHIVVFLPALYLFDKKHQWFWKNCNIVVTQVGFDYSNTLFGRLILKTTDIFHVYYDSIMEFYPEKVVYRYLSENDDFN